MRLLSSDYQQKLCGLLILHARSHVSHHLYAIYTLGAPAKVLEAAYHEGAVYQRPAFDPPEEITEANWKDHFDDEK